jgi:glycopeptide antibiotics resistance protein
MQMLTFRATDVNDLITNTFGTFLGFCFSKRLFKRKSEAGNSTGEAVMVIGIVLLVMFFVYPFVSSALWDFILG